LVVVVRHSLAPMRGIRVRFHDTRRSTAVLMGSPASRHSPRYAQAACRLVGCARTFCGTNKEPGASGKPPGSVPIGVVRGRSAAHQPEAVAAVDGARSGGPERDLRLLAATCAGRVE